MRDFKVRVNKLLTRMELRPSVLIYHNTLAVVKDSNSMIGGFNDLKAIYPV